MKKTYSDIKFDYILVRKRHRNSIKQCKTYPGADIGSDHNPVIASVSVRLNPRTNGLILLTRTYKGGAVAAPPLDFRFLLIDFYDFGIIR